MSSPLTRITPTPANIVIQTTATSPSQATPLSHSPGSQSDTAQTVLGGNLPSRSALSSQQIPTARRLNWPPPNHPTKQEKHEHDPYRLDRMGLAALLQATQEDRRNVLGVITNDRDGLQLLLEATKNDHEKLTTLPENDHEKLTTLPEELILKIINQLASLAHHESRLNGDDSKKQDLAAASSVVPLAETCKKLHRLAWTVVDGHIGMSMAASSALIKKWAGKENLKENFIGLISGERSPLQNYFEIPLCYIPSYMQQSLLEGINDLSEEGNIKHIKNAHFNLGRFNPELMPLEDPEFSWATAELLQATFDSIVRMSENGHEDLKIALNLQTTRLGSAGYPEESANEVIKSFSEMASRANKLDSVFLRDSGFTAAGICRIAEAVKDSSISSFHLRNEGLRAEDATSILKALQGSKISCLEMSHNHILAEENRDLPAALKRLSCLKELDLSDNGNVDDEGVLLSSEDPTEIINAVKDIEGFEKLNLAKTCITLNAARALVELMQKKSFKSLNLEECEFEQGEGEEPGASEILARGLQRKKTGMQSAEQSQEKISLEELILTSSSFGTKAVEILADLVENTSLHTLHLGSSETTDPLVEQEAITKIAEVIPQSQLRHLRLTDIPLDEETLEALCSALEQGRLELELHSCDISSEDIQALRTSAQKSGGNSQLIFFPQEEFRNLG